MIDLAKIGHTICLFDIPFIKVYKKISLMVSIAFYIIRFFYKEPFIKLMIKVGWRGRSVK